MKDLDILAKFSVEVIGRGGNGKSGGLVSEGFGIRIDLKVKAGATSFDDKRGLSTVEKRDLWCSRGSVQSFRTGWRCSSLLI